MQFDSKTGYITVTIGDRNQKFRVEPMDGYSIVRHAEDSRPWHPPRTATMEEEVMYAALRNACDTVTPVEPPGTATPREPASFLEIHGEADKTREVNRVMNERVEKLMEQPQRGTP